MRTPTEVRCACCQRGTTPEDAIVFCPECAARARKDCGPDKKGPALDGGRERDHRGVLLPRRSRSGGIITPQ